MNNAYYMDYFFTFITTIFCCFISLSTFYSFALKVNLVDCPGGRKTHLGDVPLIGGLAMFFGFSVVLLVVASDLNQVRGFLISSSIIIIVGALDDLNSISVRFRFIVQIIAVLVMTLYSEVVLSDLGDLLGTDTLPLGVLAIPVTTIAVVV